MKDMAVYQQRMITLCTSASIMLNERPLSSIMNQDEFEIGQTQTEEA